MKKKQPISTRIMISIISGVVALMFLGAAFGAIKLLLSDDKGKRKRHIQTVSLLKPPPPPKIKEKPPEPEIKKKEEIIEQEQEEPEPDPMEDMADDDGPMDEDLGLDADGTAGADGFGLKAKKGGRSLIGGRYSAASLLRKYSWYTSIIQENLRKKVNKHLESNGGVPDGNHVALIEITLDQRGQVTDLTLERSSGNNRMDQAVQDALLLTSVSEPPPPGMPRVVKLKISSKG